KQAAGDSQEFYWRLLKIAEPPFGRGRWTHVTVTWDGLNSSRSGRARLYLDGVERGATGVIRERFSWDATKALIRLGTGRYVGLVDDLAFFNRPLSPGEVGALHGLERGVAELRGPGWRPPAGGRGGAAASGIGAAAEREGPRLLQGHRPAFGARRRERCLPQPRPQLIHLARAFGPSGWRHGGAERFTQRLG